MKISVGLAYVSLLNLGRRFITPYFDQNFNKNKYNLSKSIFYKQKIFILNKPIKNIFESNFGSNLGFDLGTNYSDSNKFLPKTKLYFNNKYWNYNRFIPKIKSSINQFSSINNHGIHKYK